MFALTQRLLLPKVHIAAVELRSKTPAESSPFVVTAVFRVGLMEIDCQLNAYQRKLRQGHSWREVDVAGVE